MGFAVLSASVNPMRELEVVDTLLDEFEVSAEQVLIVSRPTTCGLSQSEILGDTKLTREFVEANSNSATPISLKFLKGPYRVLTHQTALRIHHSKSAIAELDDPWIAVSRVGFSDRQALICTEHRLGATYHVLEYLKGDWNYVESIPGWIS